MKKTYCLMILFLFLTNLSYGAFFQQTSSEDSGGYGVPMCFTGKKLCVVGNYIVRASGNETLFIENGIVCNEKKTQCTNGSFLLTSTKPIYE